MPELIRLLADKPVDVRYAAAEALGQIGPEAREALPAEALANRVAGCKEKEAEVLIAEGLCKPPPTKDQKPEGNNAKYIM